MTKKGKKANEFTPKSADANVYQNKFNNKRKLVPFDVKQVSSHVGEENGNDAMGHLNNKNGQFINNFNAFNNNNGGVKLTKKQRKNQAKLSKRLQQQQQQQQQQRFLNTTTNPNLNNDKILLSRKTFNNQPAIKVFKSRASFRSVFDLAKVN